ncbi:COX15/CtaA family protein [Pseudonocardia sp. GCM10023141]|uniref:COX15/CtaA family protein n=1 Tax=Pseudonocardia sp. GCM10023141 TaxID=3252653 RepID=UPI0036148C2E
MSVIARLPGTSAVVMRRIAIAALVAEVGVAIGGATVRVTGSGLGCPTWPECYPGSLVPTPHSDVAALNQWIEFGNRLLGVAVVIIAGICLLAALNLRPRRRRVTLLALAQPLGVVAQAVIGGMTVLTGLVWWSVSLHFLASIILVWLSVLLVDATSDGDGPRHLLVGRPVRGLIAASSAVLAALLVAGTLVTAAGPHAGDARTPRLDIGVPQLAQLHADLLFGYLGLLIGLGFMLRAVAAPQRVWRRYLWLVALVLLQGALGGTQYALGVPELLAALHVLGAALVTLGAAAVWSATTARPPLVTAAATAPELAEAART